MHDYQRRSSQDNPIGVDVLLETELSPQALARACFLHLPAGYAVTMIDGRELAAFGDEKAAAGARQFQIRVEPRSPAPIALGTLLDVAQDLSEVARLCALEVLMGPRDVQ